MTSTIPQKIKDLLEKHNLYNKEAAWELPQKKGTWILKHKTLEALAVAEKIIFNKPEITFNCEAVIIWVEGKRGETIEWSFGEASPANCKNQYLVAMAEKRGKDRVILKLLGLHGDAYSEEEADDFKNTDNPLSDAGYGNFAARNESAKMVEIIMNNWTPAVCELDELKGYARRLIKSEPALTDQWKLQFAKLEKLEKDMEAEAQASEVHDAN